MANLKEVRTRIASVSSTQQITSAMKMVSAAKFRRAQNAITGMRPYAQKLEEVISRMGIEDGVQTPYHKVRPLNQVLLVVITSNKGLCGAFNSNVIKQANNRIDYYTSQHIHVKVLAIGKKATEQYSKKENLLTGSHDSLLDEATFDTAATLADELMQQYADGIWDKIELIYNQFKNSLTQILTTESFLPVGDTISITTDDTAIPQDYIYEPDKESILKAMTPLMLRSQFYRAILDSLASEHGARMTAMQNATDNATTLLSELRLSYNKARQAAITNEIIEIVGGSEALKG